MIQYVVLRCDVENKMCQHRDLSSSYHAKHLTCIKRRFDPRTMKKKSMLQLADLR